MTMALAGRVGGLAVGLGIGLGIGFATCTPASAAPTDSSGSASRVGAADHSGSPAHRASAARTNLSGSRAAPKSTAGAGLPTLSASAPVLENTAAVVTWRAARRSVAGPAAPVADATNITFPWCDPRGRQITIYKGTHFAIPNSFGYFITQTVGTGTFTTNSVYDLTDVDQYDWNKFTGIAFTPLEPDRNSAMVGWRYNLTTKEFEIAPFYNVDKVRILPNEVTEVISVPADQTFQFSVDYTGITLSYGGTTVFKPYPPGLVANVWTAARVSGWFGGNEVAPRTLSYFLNLN
ncbi:MAG: hypothetical protein QNL98_06375 [Mycobacterium sp.]